MDPSNTIVLSGYLVTWLWPWGAILPFVRGDSAGRTRWIHTAACLLCLAHVVIVFQLAHHWSHQAAIEHTEEVSGFGPGLYVNYLFILVWVVDVAWSWIALDRYRNRLSWVNWLVIGFMGFIVFNAAVVFGHGVLRWLSVLLLALPWILCDLSVRRS